MSYLAKAIKNLKPNSEFVFRDEDYSSIEWIILDGDAPTKKEIDDEIKKIKTTEITNQKTKEAARQAIADRLGLTADELAILLG